MRTHLVALLSLAAACRTESISEVETRDITANITATGSGTGSTNVAATFRKGNSLTFLQLTSDDDVKVTQGGTTTELTEFSLLGVVSYSASVPVDAEGTQFTVALTRKKDSGAPSSVATLPGAFTIDALTGSFSRAAAGPTIRWSSAVGADPMTLSIEGPCIDNFSANLASGATDYTVAANALKKKMASTTDGGTAVPDSCTVTAQIARERAGTRDPGYGGGTVLGIQRRSVDFTTAP
ncbi:MAG: hypothetical protein JNK82_21030 [Myxococcaceae bacterium]|nr:hypothetical protein [Myxococcaceae bacterium]